MSADILGVPAADKQSAKWEFGVDFAAESHMPVGAFEWDTAVRSEKELARLLEILLNRHAVLLLAGFDDSKSHRRQYACSVGCFQSVGREILLRFGGKGERAPFSGGARVVGDPRTHCFVCQGRIEGEAAYQFESPLVGWLSYCKRCWEVPVKKGNITRPVCSTINPNPNEK